jgi:isopentenyldiphosphate isomerase
MCKFNVPVSAVALLMVLTRPSSGYVRSSNLMVRTMSSALHTTLSDKMMASLALRVQEVNDRGTHGRDAKFLPFVIDGKTYGYVSKRFEETLSSYPSIFQIEANELKLTADVLSKDLMGRTESVGEVTNELKNQKVITGWRDELLPVVDTFTGQPALLMERAAVPWFGVKAYGVHVNGYVRDSKTGEISHLWVAKRAKNKSTFPSMLDHIVAGGQPYGISPMDNVIKECGEEANIPPMLAAKAKSAGAVSYTNIDKHGNLKRDTLFCYDLELPKSFHPMPVDGEVESFELQPLDWVLAKVAAGGPEGYKPNCNLVVIDFLIRHGVITPESKGFLQLLDSIRGRECF